MTPTECHTESASFGYHYAKAAMIVVAFLHSDGSEVKEKILGLGGSGLVIQQGDYAVKIPKLRREVKHINGERTVGTLTPPQEDGYDERPTMIEYIMAEKVNYRRLQSHPGIIRCYDLESDDHFIRMQLLQRGNLRQYLADTNIEDPEEKVRSSWLLDLTRTLMYIHERRVLVCDIRTDNILLNEELAVNEYSVKFIDFGDSILMPLTWDMGGTADIGYSVITDIGTFGTIIYEIVTRQHCHFDLFQAWKEPGDLLKWPSRDSLPSTDGVWLGHLIERCWTEGSFQSMAEVLAELEIELGTKDEKA